MSAITLESSLLGVLFGTAAGDQIGLPYENLSRHWVQALVTLPLEPCPHYGPGMVSDDTEHTLMVAEALVRVRGDVARYPNALASELRRWLATIPPGVGGATARSILKLCLGISPRRSGVWSAGNGPAMRVALLGVYFADDLAMLRNAVEATTVLTHTDPKALAGALAVAVAAAVAFQGIASPETLWRRFRETFAAVAGPEAVHLSPAFEVIDTGIKKGNSVLEFAEQLGCGKQVSGYVLETVPVALFAWLQHANDFRAGVTAAVLCGGDTDTVGAIVGALIGAGAGPGGIPGTWLDPRFGGLALYHQLERAGQALLAMKKGVLPRELPSRWLSGLRWPLRTGHNLVAFGLVLYILACRTVKGMASR